MKARALAWLIAMVALAATAGWQLSSRPRIQSDLVAMAPAVERNAAAEAASARLAALLGERAVFLVTAADAGRGKRAAAIFASLLGTSGAFRAVRAALPAIDPLSVPRFYSAYRFRVAAAGESLHGLGEDAWRRRLDARLASPIGNLSGVGADIDPFGTLQRYLASLPFGSSRLSLDGDFLVAREGDTANVLVMATIAGSPFAPEVQRASLEAIDEAERELRARMSDARVIRTGTVFFAAAARSQAQRETSLIALGSLAGTAVLVGLLFRSLRHLALGACCVGAGMLAATVASLAAYGEIHLLTLAAGSTLIGVVVDYPLQYFARQLHEGARWQPARALAAILPGLAAGLAATLLGYAALLIVPFPALRQIALFSMVGLVAAFATACLLLPYGVRRPLSERCRMPGWPARVAAACGERAMQRRVAAAFVTLAIVFGMSLPAIVVDDDIRSLTARPASLAAQDARIRELAGVAGDSRFFLVEGADPGKVLEREEALRARLDPLVAEGSLAPYPAVSAFVPSPRRQEALLAGYTVVAGNLRAMLVETGFRPEVAGRFSRDLHAGATTPLRVEDWLATPFSAPHRHLWLGQTDRGAASIVVPVGRAEAARLASIARDLEGVTFVDKVGAISGFFAQYRRLAGVALVIALVAVWAGLAWRHGRRDATAMTLPALLAVAGAAAANAWAGMPVTLFTVLALMLVLGMSVDYAVFVRAAGAAPASRASALLGVALAAATTLLSFGLLAASSTPALRTLGVTVAVGVAIAALFAPSALDVWGERRCQA